jgi:hypothetical protein
MTTWEKERRTIEASSRTKAVFSQVRRRWWSFDNREIRPLGRDFTGIAL